MAAFSHPGMGWVDCDSRDGDPVGVAVADLGGVEGGDPNGSLKDEGESQAVCWYVVRDKLFD